MWTGRGWWLAIQNVIVTTPTQQQSKSKTFYWFDRKSSENLAFNIISHTSGYRFRIDQQGIYCQNPKSTSTQPNMTY